MQINAQILSLWDSSMGKVLDKAFNGSIEDFSVHNPKRESNIGFLASCEEEASKRTHILSKSPAACKVLSMARKRDSSIDLGPFDLPEESISDILLSCSKPTRTIALTTLGLSGNQFSTRAPYEDNRRVSLSEDTTPSQHSPNLIE